MAFCGMRAALFRCGSLLREVCQIKLEPKGVPLMNYSKEVEEMCIVAKGPKHGPAPIPEEGKWVQAKEVKDI